MKQDRLDAIRKAAEDYYAALDEEDCDIEETAGPYNEFFGRPEDGALPLLSHLDRVTAERDSAQAALGVATEACKRLRAALVGFVGADSADELRGMEAAIRLLPMPAEDKAASIDAIHALLATCTVPS